jgi:hypothetical protein
MSASGNENTVKKQPEYSHAICIGKRRSTPPAIDLRTVWGASSGRLYSRSILSPALL